MNNKYTPCMFITQVDYTKSAQLNKGGVWKCKKKTSVR